MIAHNTVKQTKCDSHSQKYSSGNLYPFPSVRNVAKGSATSLRKQLLGLTSGAEYPPPWCVCDQNVMAVGERAFHSIFPCSVRTADPSLSS